ncbi:cysteine and tyrosine-rich protein 1-like [Mercenaria mercenaria]|uniref:cysteine and tyrosine-rich protein 1-like n=1 Tax=Mercenaria mercenaria TaxID=6596 RepID=UPI00234F1808|nr:cysteine and tyrosine-rich protein 1-like [Mercenaria mercenaria]
MLYFLCREYECYYSDGRTLYCESCCEYECCDGGDGLSGGAIAGIVVGTIILLALKVCCICARVRRYQRCTRTTIVTVPRSVVVTNQHHVGYDQTRIPTIHQPNPNQARNVNQTGYDQQVPNFEPIPPPPYESVTKQTQK